jgi:curli biogenesis system outer membrane secretion channel CsgG
MQKLALVLTAALIAGCAAAPATKATHYWESDTASANRYRVDEHACQQDAGSVVAGQPAFDADSGSYEAYRECMVSRGYVLRQY